MEGCRRLTSVAPLKDSEEHCPFCAGYGAHPVDKEKETRTTPHKCYACDGSGKRIKENQLLWA